MQEDEFAGSVSNIDTCGKGMSYGEQIHFHQIVLSSYVRKEQPVYIGVPTNTYGDIVQPTMSSIPEVQPHHHHLYQCRFCSATFKSPKAYGGHMSFHSKQMKELNLIWCCGDPFD